MTNEWVALDTAMAPTMRAREVRSAWEQFVADGEAAAVRTPIADSWRRSTDAGVDPSGMDLAPVAADAEETGARWEVHPLAGMAGMVRECLAGVATESEHLIVMADADGMLLFIEGDARVRFAAADSMNFTEGALWHEGGAGTNAIGTALAADHAVQVFAGEHFSEPVQAWTCAAAPIHDPDTGEILGIIDLTGRMATAHPHSFAVAAATAEAVEAQLRLAQHEADDRLRARYLDRLAGGPDPRALVTPTGRVLAAAPAGPRWAARLAVPPGGGELLLPTGSLAVAEPVGHGDAYIVRAVGPSHTSSPPVVALELLGRDRAQVTVAGRTVEVTRRQSEILALLCARPPGLTTDELGADLYGDGANPSSVRGEVSRLRRLLGPVVGTDPYRLCGGFESDVRQVDALLRQGAVAEATERYAGALLPHSEAPGVVRAREALDAWIRSAVVSSDDRAALWAWVEGPCGEDDLEAWKRLLTRLEYRDPRRSLAVASVRRLRKAYSVAATA